MLNYKNINMVSEKYFSATSEKKERPGPGKNFIMILITVVFP